MFVESILNIKGRAVVTVEPDSLIGDLAATLASHKIGAAVVVADGAVVGIVSERDIVRYLAASADDVRPAPVSALMTRAPRTCTPGDTIDDAMNTMSTGRFRHLPVVADGKLVGIISIGDVVKSKIDQVHQEAAELRDYIAS